MWSSVKGSSYTLVVVITLFVAVFGTRHGTTTIPVGASVSTNLVPCAVQSPCLPADIQFNTVTVPSDGGH